MGLSSKRLARFTKLFLGGTIAYFLGGLSVKGNMLNYIAKVPGWCYFNRWWEYNAVQGMRILHRRPAPARACPRLKGCGHERGMAESVIKFTGECRWFVLPKAEERDS